ncbi:hypothetical protein FRC00_007837 [Tulasnella sp. 408]|nr:hypothetical protein FRC00_007837 [Tulasnella sp. 408]
MSAILAPPPASTSFLNSLESVDMKRFRSFLAYAHFRALKDDMPRLAVVKRKNRRLKVQNDRTPQLDPITEKSPLTLETVAEETGLLRVDVEGQSLELVRVETTPSVPGGWNLTPPTPPLTPEASSTAGAAPPSPVFYASAFLYPSTADLLDPASPVDRDEPAEAEGDVMAAGTSKKMYLIPSMATGQSIREPLGRQGTAEHGLDAHQLRSNEPSAKAPPFSTRVVSVTPSSLQSRSITSFSLTGVPPVCVDGPSTSFLAEKLSTFKTRVRNRWASEGAIGDLYPSASTPLLFKSCEIFDDPGHAPPPIPRSPSSVCQVYSRSQWSESSCDHLAMQAATGHRESARFRFPWTRPRGSTVGSSEPSVPRSFWGQKKH